MQVAVDKTKLREEWGPKAERYSKRELLGKGGFKHVYDTIAH
jgi:hypothetical protein